MTVLWLVVFVFFTIGIKIILGVAVCYLLVPRGAECPACDGNTVAVQPARGAAWLAALTRIDRRWCTGCARPFWARRAETGWLLRVRPGVEETSRGVRQGGPTG